VKPRPVRRDVASVAHGIDKISGRLAQLVHDLDAPVFCPFDPVGIDGVDDGDR